jgi:hypothetical protein
MAKTFHFRFEPKQIPDDWREDSLHRAAVWLNKDTDIPAVFPQDSLDYLSELGYSLPRRGIMFITSAREFVHHLAIGVLAACDAADVNELRDIRKRKENAVADCDFEAAAALRDRQDELETKIAKFAIHDITRAEIVDALVRDGVDPEGNASQSGAM